MTPDFHRIRRLPPYVLEEVNRIKARLRAQGVDIIDFGMGNPDMPTPKHIVDKMIETARDPKAGRYSASKGIVGLRRAMAGWRVGMVVGNARICAALARVKSYLDYGAYTPIQVAAAAALNGPQDCVDEIRAIYKSRRDVLVDSMHRAGWDIPSPSASMFAWAPVPEPFRAAGSLLFSKVLIEEAGVAVAPGVGFGEYGEGYVRVGLVENEHRIRQAARNVKKFLANADAILARAHNALAAQ